MDQAMKSQVTGDLCDRQVCFYLVRIEIETGNDIIDWIIEDIITIPGFQAYHLL